MAVVETEKSEKTLGGKFLTFILAGEEYGIEILKVRDIIGLMAITPVPKTPAFVKGVINLRGKIIPVVDLRTRFDMEATVRDRQTCIVVVDLGRLQMGVVIDQVSEVLDIAAKDVEPTPDFGVEFDTGFILGMGKIGERVIILLNINRVLTGEEMDALAAVPSAVPADSGHA